MNKLSALLITLNEENNIDAVLKNLYFADEIIVVDSFSTDTTPDRVRTHPKAKLIQRAFKNYTDQKTYAIAQASYNWILFIDADERIPKALENEIIEEMNADEDETVSAYFFKRTFMFKNEVLRFSGWQSDKNHRLFKKDSVHFDCKKIVHETLVVNGKSKTLRNKLIHYSYSNYQSYKAKMLKYGAMKALGEHKDRKRAHWYHFLFRPTYKFLNHYILRLGILDGKKGIIICYLNALGVLHRYRELKKFNNNVK